MSSALTECCLDGSAAGVARGGYIEGLMRGETGDMSLYYLHLNSRWLFRASVTKHYRRSFSFSSQLFLVLDCTFTFSSPHCVTIAPAAHFTRQEHGTQSVQSPGKSHLSLSLFPLSRTDRDKTIQCAVGVYALVA